MDTAVYIISYQFETCLEILPMNIIFYGVTIHIYSLRCVSFLSYHKALLSNTCMVYSEHKTPIFVSESPFRFLTWLRITECGKLHEYFSDVQGLVRVLSYLHLSPGKGFYARKCVYYRFMIAIPKILLHITKRCCSQKKKTKREANRNGK
jgi:hypothetical protein